MGLNRRKIRVKATNISVMDRKGEKSILGCQIMSGAITATVIAHSHLDRGVRNLHGDSLHPTMSETGSHTGRSTRHIKK